LYAGGMPHIFGKLSTRAIIFFKIHFNRRFAHSIEGLHKKLWAPKVVKVLILGISGLLAWETQDKMTFGCNPHGQAQRIL